MPIRNKFEIGESIKTMRQRRHMSCRELADRMSDMSGEMYSGNQISKWENGINEPSLRGGGILAEALDCSVFALLTPDRQTQQVEWLTADERSIMLFGVSSWQGNIHAAIQALNMYMALPPDRRADVVNAAITEYDAAAKQGILQHTTVPVDRAYILREWRRL